MLMFTMTSFPSHVHRRYHTSVSDWNFGKLSALQEIALTLEGGYRFYYMGQSQKLCNGPSS